jgi:hypothetical protein
MTGTIARNDNDPRYQEGYEEAIRIGAMSSDVELMKLEAYGPLRCNDDEVFDEGWVAGIKVIREIRKV